MSIKADTVEQNRRKRQVSLQRFFEENAGKLGSMNKWAIASGVAYNTINQILLDKRRRNIRSDTYEKLAQGASTLLGRPVSVIELMPGNGDHSEKAACLSRLSALLDALSPEDLRLAEEMLERLARSQRP